MHKKCSKCKEWKPYDEYALAKRDKTGRASSCKQCFRELHKLRTQEGYKRPYTVQRKNQKRVWAARKFWPTKTVAEVEAELDRLMQVQNNSCAICKLPESNFKRKLSVDHDHKTGQVRGLLCDFCNLGLGNFKENVLIFDSAKKYLQKDF